MNYDEECRALLAQIAAVANERWEVGARLGDGATNPLQKLILRGSLTSPLATACLSLLAGER